MSRQHAKSTNRTKHETEKKRLLPVSLDRTEVILRTTPWSVQYTNRTVLEFVQIVFEELELNYEDHLIIDPRFYRPAEVEILVANPAKACEKLGWNPKVNFKELALNMVRADYDLLMKNKWLCLF